MTALLRIRGGACSIPARTARFWMSRLTVDCHRSARCWVRAGVVVVAVVGTIAPYTVNAQSPERRHSVSFAAGASLGDGNTALASTVGLGVRLSERVGLELELAHARKLDFTLDLCPAPRVCVVGGRVPVTGRIVSLVPQVIIDLVPGSQRVSVYAQAGVGAGHLRQRYFSGLPPANLSERVELTRSSPAIALSFGGGAAVAISSRFAIGIDLRSLHVLDDPAPAERHITPAGTLTTVRIGSRATWRF